MRTIRRGVWNLPHKFHLYLIYILFLFQEKESLFVQEKSGLEASIVELSAKIGQLEEESRLRVAQEPGNAQENMVTWRVQSSTVGIWLTD